MSRGISIYYKLKYDEPDGIVYEYSGIDMAEYYEEHDCLSYDGEIFIHPTSLHTMNATDALKTGSAIIVRSSKRDYKTLYDEQNETGYSFFAVQLISKIFRKYKEEGKLAEKDRVVY